MFSARRVVGLGVLAIALVGCGGMQPTTDKTLAKPSPPATPVGPPAIPAGELARVGQATYANWGGRDARGVATLDMDAGDFYFKGTFIRGVPDQALTLEIRNVAARVHNFSLPAQGLDQDIPPKSDRVNVAITFPKSGRLQFFCKLHTAQGMNGILLLRGLRARAVASPSPSTSPQPTR